jgi:MFS family permease
VARALSLRGTVDWRTLRSAAVLSAVSFGYGGVTSFVALFAEQRGIHPKGIFFTAFAVSILLLRPLLGSLVDRVGAARVLPPSILLVAVGLALVPLQRDATGLAIVALVYGAGFSTLYPAFSSLVLTRIPDSRHGAAFGAMLAAFDVGIGSGSLAFGLLVTRFGSAAAFLTGAALTALAWPLHLVLERIRARAHARAAAAAGKG